MERIVILDALTTDQGDAAIWHPLAALGQVDRHDRTGADEVIERIGDARIVLTNKVPIDRGIVAACPKLAYVGVLATGYNIIDCAACRDRGIAVSNVPAYSTDSVAQLVFAQVLAVVNRVAIHNQRVHDGDWQRSPDFCFIDGTLQELAGKTLLVIGTGAIGSAVARIGKAFGMEVLSGRVPGRPSRPDRMDLDEALPLADVISLHCPLTEATHHLVDGAFLNRCKSTAILVNTGRGPLIDDVALTFALDNGLLAHACCDVLTAEPPPADHPLIGHPRVTITPHIGWATTEARQRLVRGATGNLEAFQQGRELNRVEG